MRVVVQRVHRGAVEVDGNRIGEIDAGLVLLVGVTHGDTEDDADWLADKVAGLRIFENEAGRFDLSLRDVGGSALVVPQFTLYADTSKGRRPSFTDAAPPEIAEPLIDYFVQALRDQGLPVETGRFGAYMQVHIQNDGPVTILLDSPA